MYLATAREEEDEENGASIVELFDREEVSTADIPVNSPVKFVTNQNFEELTQKDMCPHFKEFLLKNLFISGSRKIRGHNLPKRIEEEVFSVLKQAQDRLTGSAFEGRFVGCGSYYEGTKVGYPDEFDYTYELVGVPHEELEITQQNPPSCKPGRQPHEHVASRAYYKIFYSSRDSTLGTRLQHMQGEEDSTPNSSLELDARKVLTKFSQILKESIGCREDIHAELNGPAVTVRLTLTESFVQTAKLSHREQAKLEHLAERLETVHVKVDIALALPLRRPRDSSSMWPLQDKGGVQLEERIKKPIKKCHLVPSGDFWKASFTKTEMKIMKSAPNKAKEIFMAIKTMRDSTSVTRPHETVVLKTYTLKVAFFKELYWHSNARDWSWRASPTRVKNILNTILMTKGRHSLTGYFIRDDPVLMESDRSYLEIRRIIKEFYALQQHRMFHLYGKWVFAFFFFILGCLLFFLNSFWLSDLCSNFRSGSDNSTSTLNHRSPYEWTVYLYLYFVVLLAIATVMFTAASQFISRPQSGYSSSNLSVCAQVWRHVSYQCKVAGVGFCVVFGCIYLAFAKCGNNLSTEILILFSLAFGVITLVLKFHVRYGPLHNAHRISAWEEIYASCRNSPCAAWKAKKTLRERIYAWFMLDPLYRLYEVALKTVLVLVVLFWLSAILLFTTTQFKALVQKEISLDFLQKQFY